MSEREGAPTLDVKISDEEIKGRYANLLRVTHTREEFSSSSTSSRWCPRRVR
jgi:hypothetical protein